MGLGKDDFYKLARYIESVQLTNVAVTQVDQQYGSWDNTPSTRVRGFGMVNGYRCEFSFEFFGTVGVPLEVDGTKLEHKPDVIV